MDDLIFLYENPERLNDLIDEFRAKRSYADEITELKSMIEKDDAERMRIIFYVKILSKCVVKKSDVTEFHSTVLREVGRRNSIKNGILVLNMINSLGEGRAFVPVVFEALKLLAAVVATRPKAQISRKFSLDRIKITSDDMQSVELQLFLVEEAIGVIRRSMSAHSKSIGFPELAEAVNRELRKAKVGDFKEVVGSLVNRIEKRRLLILKEREEAFRKEDVLDENKVREFEKKIGSVEM
ncbi:hypothetical protein ECANGB1_775 [Enterospora canceri]|uniref:Uncharacterized protein n=1 Tax=Enterospora canceri TaxID=1081671 RepID=A0A1Y1S7H6_9MICR|nr:hypothetical protein ECANGB1_775 [Enterospora canceri]